MNTPKILAGIGLSFLCFVATGCASYYKVTDPTSGRVYYTQKVDQLDNGGAKLTDASNGNMVTIQNSEVQKITEEQYNAGRMAPPTTSPAN